MFIQRQWHGREAEGRGRTRGGFSSPASGHGPVLKVTYSGFKESTTSDLDFNALLKTRPIFWQQNFSDVISHCGIELYVQDLKHGLFSVSVPLL